MDSIYCFDLCPSVTLDPRHSRTFGESIYYSQNTEADGLVFTGE